MRSFVPMKNASNVVAMNCESHRLKKSQEVDLFIQRLVYIRRFTTRLCCNCFVTNWPVQTNSCVYEESYSERR